MEVTPARDVSMRGDNNQDGSQPQPTPIMIPCEGTGADLEYCPMCARRGTPPVPPHTRLDILAMLRRGDFDA